jgi:perosamine synthetase
LIHRFGKEEIKAVTETIAKSSFLSGYTNKYLGGEEIQKFEKEFARFHHCKYGITVNSGTTALFVAQLAAGVKPGKKIAVPCYTFTATTSQIVACGAKPVFQDIDYNSYCMNSIPKNTKFAIPVHLLGHPCKSEFIKEMLEKNIFVIEDCAQATGAKVKGKSVGSLGNCGVFSFQETKHITTLGEGGIIVTNNEEFAEKCRKIRNHGEYYMNDSHVGYNFRITEAQAAFGRVQLKKLPKIIETFRKNALFIFKNLPNEIIPPNIPKNISHSFLLLGCRFSTNSNLNKNIFLERLTKNRKKFLDSNDKSDIKGINFRPGKIIGAGYKVVQYQIPLYKKYHPKKPCKNGEEYVKNGIFLDIHRWRSKSEIKEELSIINRTLESMKN